LRNSESTSAAMPISVTSLNRSEILYGRTTHSPVGRHPLSWTHSGRGGLITPTLLHRGRHRRDRPESQAAPAPERIALRSSHRGVRQTTDRHPQPERNWHTRNGGLSAPTSYVRSDSGIASDQSRLPAGQFVSSPCRVISDVTPYIKHES
jgi:hypothetical protein